MFPTQRRKLESVPSAVLVKNVKSNEKLVLFSDISTLFAAVSTKTSSKGGNEVTRMHVPELHALLRTGSPRPSIH